MSQIVKLIECLKSHLDQNDVIKPFSRIVENQGSTKGFVVIDPLGEKGEEGRWLVCTISICDKDNDLKEIIVGKSIDWPRFTNFKGIYAISGGSKGIPHCGDTLFSVRNKEFIVIRPYDINGHDIKAGSLDVNIEGLYISQR